MGMAANIFVREGGGNAKRCRRFRHRAVMSKRQAGEVRSHRLNSRLTDPTVRRRDTRGSSLLLRSCRIGRGHGMKGLSAYRGQRFVQSVEDVIGADDVAQVAAVKIGPQRRFRVNEHHRYAAAD
jgi:hypothetical protein